MTETRILVFGTQAAAQDGAVSITRTAGIKGARYSGSTLMYAEPRPLADGRWCIPYPSDKAWLEGATGYVVADGFGQVAVAEGWRYLVTLTSPDPSLRVVSVLPVALRRALRATDAPGGAAPDALAYVLAALGQPGYEEPRDAFEFMVRAYRDDILQLGGALGFKTEQIDEVLTLAASYPGAEAEYTA